MSIKYRNLWIGLAAFGSAIYLVSASEPAMSSSAEHQARLVKVAEVTLTKSSREMRFSGVTRAARRARLAFFLGGRIVERPVEVGDRVREGQLVARLDDLELRNAIAGAEGTLGEIKARRSQAERDFERAERLLEAKAATGEEVEKTRAGLDATRAAEEAASAKLRETERLLGETRLLAPFAGTITEVHFEPGEVTTPGRTVATLAGEGAVELELEVPESVVPRIAVGDLVEVVPVYGGAAPIEAKVTSVGRAASGEGSLFPIVVQLPPSSRVAVGGSAELVLSLESDNALSVPVEAVVDPGGRRPAVFRFDGERVEKVFIQIGALLGDRVVVAGDLEAGDQVVVGGQRGLLDGDAVQVAQEPAR